MTEKTINFYELGKIIDNAANEINTRLHNKAFQDDRYIVGYIQITNSYSLSTMDIVNLEVNWKAIGATTLEKTQAYAEALAEAVEFCKNSGLNGSRITFD